MGIDKEPMAKKQVPAIIVQDANAVRTLLQDGQREEFAELLIESNLRMHDLSDVTREKLLALNVPLDGKLVPKTHQVRLEPDWEIIRKYIAKNYARFAEEGNLLVATYENKIAGMLGIERVDHDGDNEIFELCHAVVHPDARRNNISFDLIKAAVERIRTISPGASVLAYTQNEAIMKTMKKLHARELSVEEYVNIDTPVGSEWRDETLERRQEKAQNGWKAFLLDLSKENA